jgi:hypothetical protein
MGMPGFHRANTIVAGFATRDLYTAQQAMVPEGFSLIANEILDRFPEINSSNYSHDDVDRLNAWGIELVLSVGKGTV